MCTYRADVASVDAPLDQLEEDGLIRRSGNRIEVTDEGRPLVRTVAAAFDTYLPSSTATHVTAV
jgi:oxygen-independent coproporphyrinogen-3 oxidase